MANAAGVYAENEKTGNVINNSFDLINNHIGLVRNQIIGSDSRAEQAEQFLEELMDIANAYTPGVNIDYDPIGDRGRELIEIILDFVINTIQNGGTGVNAAVEAAIWAREQERAELASEEAKDTMAGDWARTGFSLPDGVLTTMFSEVDRKYQDSRLTTSRDIAIKTFELEQKNLHAMMQNAAQILTEMIKGASQIASTEAEEQTKEELGQLGLYGDIGKARASLESQILSAIFASVNLGSNYSASGSASESASASGQVHLGGTTNVNHEHIYHH